MARRVVEPPPAPAWKRYVIVGTVVVVVVVAAIWFFWPRIQVSLWVSQLHSDDTTVRQNARDSLAASDVKGLNDTLYGVLVDPGQSLAVRIQIGEILVARNRLALVEQALRAPDVPARFAALVVLHDRVQKSGAKWFERSYMDSSLYDVRGTLSAWLDRKGDLTRSRAVEIVSQLGLSEMAPKLRSMLALPREGRLTSAESALIASAARALVAFRVCDAVPDVLHALQKTHDADLQFSLLGVVFDSAVGMHSICKGQVPPEEVRTAVVAALHGPSGASAHQLAVLRQKSLLLLQQKPEWLENVKDEVLGILDDAQHNTAAVRRAALAALAAGRTDEFGLRLPRYFHDPDPYVRSEAVTASRLYAEEPGEPIPFESCWIGLVRDETQNRVAFGQALSALKQKAGRWIGVTPEIESLLKKGDTYDQFVSDLFTKGESHGLDRDAWAEGWFRWWAAQLGLDGAGVEKAVQTRKKFWEAARGRDRTAAKAALDAYGDRPQGLFTYEEGWLAASS